MQLVHRAPGFSGHIGMAAHITTKSISTGMSGALTSEPTMTTEEYEANILGQRMKERGVREEKM